MISLEFWILTISVAIALINFVYWIKKPPFKQWLMLYFVSSSIAVFLDTLFVDMGLYEFEFDLLPYTDISDVFDYIVYPIIVVWMAYWTYRMKWWQTVLIIILLSFGLALFENWLEVNTELIIYHHWSWETSLIWFIGIGILLRLLMEAFKKYYKE